MNKDDTIIAQKVIIIGLQNALGNLMDAVGDMPADPEECWPEEWQAAQEAFEQTHKFLRETS